MRFAPGALITTIVAILFLPCSAALAQDEEGREQSGVEEIVHLIEIEGEITDGLPHYVERAVQIADEQESELLVVRIRSFGGLVTAAASIKDALMAAEVPTVAFVDRRAISAGALIAMACDRIAVAPGATIGAATPYRLAKGGAPQVTEKMISAVRAIFRSTAESNGHPSDIAEAMVDPDVEIAGVSEKGKLLTLTAEQAVEVGLAAMRAENTDELLSELKPGKEVRLVAIPISPAERVADALGKSYLAGILLTIGMLALIAAFKIPGTGLPEAIAILAFGAFLFGKYIAGLAGIEDVVLISGGLILLALEIFFIPGTGVTGILGLLSLMAGIVLAFVGESVDSPFFVREIKHGVVALGVSLAGTVCLSVALFLGLRRTRFWKRFSLQRESTSPEPGSELHSEPATELPNAEALTGSTGFTLTAMRPEGEVEMDGRRFLARAERGYIESGTEVIVVDIEGPRVIVAPVKVD